jgi:hypothetical protein
VRTVAILLMYVCTVISPLVAEQRFGRDVIKVQNPSEYQFFKLDDVQFPMLFSTQYAVSCLVYRGTQRYYVEIGVQNKGSAPLNLPVEFVSFNKPGYTVFRTDTVAAARDVAERAGGQFVPTPPPQMPSTTNSTLNATATTYGNQTQITGTTTTTTDQSGQAGANLGNAIGNALAARSYYKTQRRESIFTNFLATFAQDQIGTTLQPGEAKVIVATFEQAKRKKAPFDIVVRVGAESFLFRYKE